MENELYVVHIRNVPFRQAQALYRFLVNLDDDEPMFGAEGLNWSGVIPGVRNERKVERTVTIEPMENEMHELRRLRELETEAGRKDTHG
jgi:hypothetical protein